MPNRLRSMLMLSASLCAFMQCEPKIGQESENTHSPRIVPDAQVQEQIKTTSDALADWGENPGDDARVIAAHDALRDLRDIDTRELLRQLVLFFANADEREGYGALAIFKYSHVSEPMMVSAIAPLFGSGDPKIENWVVEFSKSVEGGRRRPPDFSYYVNHLTAVKDDPPLGLVEHMFRRASGTALLSLMSVYSPADQEIIWAEHVVSDAIWKRERQFHDAADEAKPAAVEQLAKLAKSDQWWARVYVAEILRKHPEFQTPRMVLDLEMDEHPLVQKVVRSFRGPLGPQ